jgi:hypothetical protein
MAHNPPQHVVQIFPGIDIEVFAGFNQAPEQYRRPAAPLAADKKPVLAAQGYRTHRVFGRIGVGLQTPIFNVAT